MSAVACSLRALVTAVDNHRHRPTAVQRRAERHLPDAGGVLGWVVLAGAVILIATETRP